MTHAASDLCRSHSDLGGSRPLLKWIDEHYYRTSILQVASDINEQQIDDQLRQEADSLGIVLLQVTTDIEGISASLSATTIASEPTNQSSFTSQSTAPTSCSSSEHRPVTSSTHRSERIPSKSSPALVTSPILPTALDDIQKKRRTGIRDGFRKMAGLTRKRKPVNGVSMSLTSIESGSFSDVASLRSPIEEDSNIKQRTARDIEYVGGNSVQDLPTKSPSRRSSKSSDVWSSRVSSAAKSNDEAEEALIDHEALRRTMDCVEIVTLRSKQMDERERLLDYQSQILARMRAERDQIKAQKKEEHTRILSERREKNEKAVEDLESRQLEDELRMDLEHENEKRAIVARLRHMEAYCQNPSPPSTPIEATFSGSDRTSSPVSVARGSTDSVAGVMTFPERKVTDRDYHNLASCYRERDVMDNLHASKINVLRGRQKRAVEKFVAKKDDEIMILKSQHSKEIDNIDQEFGLKEAECRAEIWEKRQVLERRWRLQAMVAKARAEKQTGLKHEFLPDITLAESGGIKPLVSIA